MRAATRYSLAVDTLGLPSPARRPLHFLYRDGCPAVRARTARRAVEALLTHLGDQLLAATGEMLRLRALALVAGEVAVLVPDGVRRRLPRLERRLRAAGLDVADVPQASLDPASGRLVIPEPLVPFDAARARALGPAAAAGTEPRVPPGRYPVAVWAVTARADGAPSASRARLLAHLLPLVTNRDQVGGRTALTGLATALAGARPVAMPVDLPALPGVLGEAVRQ